MRNVLVDTDVLIDFLRGKEYARVFLSSLVDESSVVSCSVITVAEIFAGMREHEREMTEELLNSLDILDVTYEIAEHAGRYKNTIKSHKLELDDCLIAATAFVNNAFLATGNTRHYPMKDIQKIEVKSPPARSNY